MAPYLDDLSPPDVLLALGEKAHCQVVRLTLPEITMYTNAQR